MKKFLVSILALACGVAAIAQSDYGVNVVYNGDTATVSVGDSAAQYLTVTQQGAHVSIAQSSNLATESLVPIVHILDALGERRGYAHDNATEHTHLCYAPQLTEEPLHRLFKSCDFRCNIMSSIADALKHF